MVHLVIEIQPAQMVNFIMAGKLTVSSAEKIVILAKILPETVFNAHQTILFQTSLPLHRLANQNVHIRLDQLATPQYVCKNLIG